MASEAREGPLVDLLDRWLQLPESFSRPLCSSLPANSQDQDCYEVPVTRYTYISPREWTGTWRLLLVCALAYAGLLATSILFDLIRLPCRHWLWRQSKAWRGFYMRAWAEGGLLLTTLSYTSDVLIVISALGLAVTFIFRANWPPTASEEIDPPLWGQDHTRDLLDMIDISLSSLLASSFVFSVPLSLSPPPTASWASKHAPLSVWALKPTRAAWVMCIVSVLCNALRLRGSWLPFSFIAPVLVWAPLHRVVSLFGSGGQGGQLSGLASGMISALFEAVSLMFLLSGTLYMLEELGDPTGVNRLWGNGSSGLWKAWAFSLGSLTTVGADVLGGESPKSLLGLIAAQIGLGFFVKWGLGRGARFLRWAVTGGSGGESWEGGGGHLVVGGCLGPGDAEAIRASLFGWVSPNRVCIIAEGGGGKGGLDGDIGEEKGMVRAGAGKAKSVLVMSGSKGGADDAKAMLRAILVSQARSKIRVLVQVRGAAWANNPVGAAGGGWSKTGLQVVRTGDIVSSLLARGLVDPVIISVVCNLVSSPTHSEVSKGARRWDDTGAGREYANGTLQGLYRITIPAAFNGFAFGDLAMMLHRKVGCVLLALSEGVGSWMRVTVLPRKSRPIVGSEAAWVIHHRNPQEVIDSIAKKGGGVPVIAAPHLVRGDPPEARGGAKGLVGVQPTLRGDGERSVVAGEARRGSRVYPGEVVGVTVSGGSMGSVIDVGFRDAQLQAPDAAGAGCEAPDAAGTGCEAPEAAGTGCEAPEDGPGRETGRGSPASQGGGSSGGAGVESVIVSGSSFGRDRRDQDGVKLTSTLTSEDVSDDNDDNDDDDEEEEEEEEDGGAGLPLGTDLAVVLQRGVDGASYSRGASTGVGRRGGKENVELELADGFSLLTAMLGQGAADAIANPGAGIHHDDEQGGSKGTGLHPREDGGRQEEGVGARGGSIKPLPEVAVAELKQGKGGTKSRISLPPLSMSAGASVNGRLHVPSAAINGGGIARPIQRSRTTQTDDLPSAVPPSPRHPTAPPHPTQARISGGSSIRASAGLDQRLDPPMTGSGLVALGSHYLVCGLPCCVASFLHSLGDRGGVGEGEGGVGEGVVNEGEWVTQVQSVGGGLGEEGGGGHAVVFLCSSTPPPLAQKEMVEAGGVFVLVTPHPMSPQALESGGCSNAKALLICRDDLQDQDYQQGKNSGPGGVDAEAVVARKFAEISYPSLEACVVSLGDARSACLLPGGGDATLGLIWDPGYAAGGILPPNLDASILACSLACPQVSSLLSGMLGGEGSGGVICVVQDVARAAGLDHGEGTYGQAFDSFILAGRGILIGLVRSNAGSRYPVTNPWRKDEIRPGDCGLLLSLPWQGGAEGSQWEKGSGVGIVWGVGGQVGQLVVRGFAAGGDAEGAGVRVGDVLMGVGDASALPSGVGPMDEAGLIKSLRGKHGSEVRLRLRRSNGGGLKVVTVKRIVPLGGWEGGETYSVM